MIQAVFFDVDGTLVSHKTKSVPPSTRKAIALLKQNKIKVFLATGRHPNELQDLPLNDLVFDGYVALNGQICFDQDKKVVYANAIHEEDQKQVITWFQEKTMPIVLVEEKQLYANYLNEEVRQAQEEISSPMPMVKAYTGDAIYQVVLYGDHQKIEDAMAKLTHCLKTSWSDCAVDVISKEGGKVSGIKQLLAHYGLQDAEIMAFGDGENDLDMLEYANVGVAMGNAIEEVKEAADFVTTDVDEDGIYQALQKYELIK